MGFSDCGPLFWVIIWVENSGQFSVLSLLVVEDLLPSGIRLILRDRVLMNRSHCASEL